MDFIGTGEQVHEFAEAALERYTWLKTRSIFVCAIAGYNDGIQTLEKNLSDFGVRVLVARTLSSDDRAFSANNSLWDSETDREQARLWCQQLGTLLVQGEFTDPAVHALGWKGSEALISFHYNTPNNTLPIFWAQGRSNGTEWQPLFPRF